MLRTTPKSKSHTKLNIKSNPQHLSKSKSTTSIKKANKRFKPTTKPTISTRTITTQSTSSITSSISNQSFTTKIQSKPTTHLFSTFTSIIQPLTTKITNLQTRRFTTQSPPPQQPPPQSQQSTPTTTTQAPPKPAVIEQHEQLQQQQSQQSQEQSTTTTTQDSTPTLNHQPIKYSSLDEQQQDPNQTSQQSTDSTTTTTQESTPEQSSTPNSSTNPQYSHFRRTISKAKQQYKPTESYFDENGDECLVIYEADDATIQLQLRERLRSLANALIVAPSVAVTSFYTIPAPYSGIMIALASITAMINIGRIYGIHAFVTKITAVWPQEQSEITDKMKSNLQEALMGLQPLDGEESTSSTSKSEDNEQIQRLKRTHDMIKKRQEEYTKTKNDEQLAQNNENNVNNENDTTTKDTTDNTTSPNQQQEQQQQQDDEKIQEPLYTQPKTRLPIYPEPGVDPMGRPFSFNLNAPDQLTWQFGWADVTRRVSAEDKKTGIYPLYERAGFSDQVRAWSSLQDCDFPEYYYIDRLNDGKTFLYQKVPFSDIAAVWSKPIVPPVIPQVTPELIDQTQSRPHDQMVLMVRAQNTVTGLFPKFFKHDVAINQFIFGTNINSRNECKGKFEDIRGKIKL